MQVDQWEADGIFPAHELFKKMGDNGFLGVTKPTKFGGLGLDYRYMLVPLGVCNCPLTAAALGTATAWQWPRSLAASHVVASLWPLVSRQTWPPQPLPSLAATASGNGFWRHPLPAITSRALAYVPQVGSRARRAHNAH